MPEGSHWQGWRPLLVLHLPPAADLKSRMVCSEHIIQQSRPVSGAARNQDASQEAFAEGTRRLAL